MSEKTPWISGGSPESADSAEAEGSSGTTGSLTRRSRLGLVPADYAEKTMSSLMSLHEDLMAEKERALDVTRRLMTVQQDRAELESYVRILEAELQRRGGPAMGTLRAAGTSGLETATETVLRSLAGAAPAPAPVPATASIPAPAVAPVPQAEVAPAPRPPRPSAAYRAPVAPAAPEESGSSELGTGEARPAVAVEGWRQW